MIKLNKTIIFYLFMFIMMFFMDYSTLIGLYLIYDFPYLVAESEFRSGSFVTNFLLN